MTTTDWTITSLNKAYQQGYMSGLAGRTDALCPYENEILRAAWDSGKDDGAEQGRLAELYRKNKAKA